MSSAPSKWAKVEQCALFRPIQCRSSRWPTGQPTHRLTHPLLAHPLLAHPLLAHHRLAHHRLAHHRPLPTLGPTLGLAQFRARPLALHLTHCLLRLLHLFFPQTFSHFLQPSFVLSLPVPLSVSESLPLPLPVSESLPVPLSVSESLPLPLPVTDTSLKLKAQPFQLDTCTSRKRLSLHKNHTDVE